MVRRGLMVLLVALSCVLTAAAPASAGGLYYTTASDGALESTAGRLHGVSADSWVLFDPHEVYSLHLNSVYMWYDTDSYVEAGWAWYAGDGPQAYVAYERKGYTREQERVWLGPVEPGSWVRLEIVNESLESSGPVRWDCRIGDKTAAVYQDFDRATVRVSSERQTYRDSGYGLFERLTRLGRDGRWSLWRDMRIQNGDQDYEGHRWGAGGFEVH